MERKLKIAAAILAVLAVIVIVIVVLYKRGGYASPSAALAAVKASPASVVTALAKGKYTPLTPDAVWDAAPQGGFTCPASAVPGYCIVPEASVEAVCDGTPGCVGYLTPGATSAWAKAYPGMAQAVKAAPTSQSAYPDTLFYKKN
jgi:hypothetical protein